MPQLLSAPPDPTSAAHRATARRQPTFPPAVSNFVALATSTVLNATKFEIEGAHPGGIGPASHEYVDQSTGEGAWDV
jgi:hypothetical protein